MAMYGRLRLSIRWRRLFLHHGFTRTDPGGRIDVALDNADALEQFAHMLFAHDLDVLLYCSSGSFPDAIPDLLFHKDSDLFGHICSSRQLRDPFTDQSAL